MSTSCFMNSAKTKKFNGNPEKILRQDPGLFSHNRFANACRRGEAVVMEWRGRHLGADFRFLPVGVEGLHFVKGHSQGRKKAALPAAPDSYLSFCADNSPADAPHIGSEPATGRMAAKVDGSNRRFRWGASLSYVPLDTFMSGLWISDPRPFRFCSPPFNARRDNRAG